MKLFDNEQELIKFEKDKEKIITANSYIVVDLNTNKTLLSRNEKKVREVASLTKIMNFYTCHRILQ